MKTSYENRYGDIFTFTEDEDHNILWEGNFEYGRIGFPNDYTRAYKAYMEDHCYSDHCMNLEQFKKYVHEYDDETHEYVYPKYIKMVDSLTNEISMVDPSGGPYISRGYELDYFGFKGRVVEDFKRITTGYKIITKPCPYCGLKNGSHKMGCETTKIQVNL